VDEPADAPEGDAHLAGDVGSEEDAGEWQEVTEEHEQVALAQEQPPTMQPAARLAPVTSRPGTKRRAATAHPSPASNVPPAPNASPHLQQLKKRHRKFKPFPEKGPRAMRKAVNDVILPLVGGVSGFIGE